MRGLYRLRLSVVAGGSALLLFGLTPASASSANISHSYNATTSIESGSLVSLDPSQSNYVLASNSDNGQQLLGVATESSQSLLAVDASAGTVQVATNGTVNALVSTFNGPISVGDQIAVSPFNGVGAKAGPGAYVVGLAQTAFSSSSSGATQETVKDKQGQSHQLSVGFVRLNIAIGLAATSASGDGNLNGLQKLAQSITGHVVSTPRVVISLVIALIALAALITLIYASIYGAIISLGRNPLAKYSVFRSLGITLTIAFFMAVVSSLTIFFLLR